MSLSSYLRHVSLTPMAIDNNVGLWSKTSTCQRFSKSMSRWPLVPTLIIAPDIVSDRTISRTYPSP